MNFNIRNVIFAMVSISSLAMSGCATTNLPVSDINRELIVTPSLPDYQTEITLAKLNEILSKAELNDQQRAQFLYDRAVVYDRLGLSILARLDFMQVSKLNPTIADTYNYLGLYYSLGGESERAYEAFDSAIELDPEFKYPFLNRGIAFYYGKRYDLAVQDLEKYYLEDKTNAYGALWLYIANSELDQEAALIQLRENQATLENNEWTEVLIDFYLGKSTEKEVITAAAAGVTQHREYTERLCEAYFYLGKMAQNNQQLERAENYYRLALTTNVFDFIEYRYAGVELTEILTEKAEAEENQEQSAQENSEL